MTVKAVADNGAVRVYQAPEEYLTLEQAGELLGVTGRTIFNFIREGRLRASKLGHRIVRVKRSDIDRMLSEHATVTE
jgi:excisionase family DNA binding protein